MVDDSSIGFVIPQHLQQEWIRFTQPIWALARDPRSEISLALPANAVKPNHYSRSWHAKTKEVKPRAVFVSIEVSDSTLKIKASHSDLLLKFLKPAFTVHDRNGAPFLRNHRQKIVSDTPDMFFSTEGMYDGNQRMIACKQMFTFHKDQWTLAWTSA